MKQSQVQVRVSSLAKTLNTIQKTLELLGGSQKEGAILALNAVRREYGIPIQEDHDK